MPELLPHVDTMGDSSDSRTASAGEPISTEEQRLDEAFRRLVALTPEFAGISDADLMPRLNYRYPR